LGAVTAPPTVAPPPGHPRFPQIDGVRALAALLIFAYHIAYITNALYYGWASRFTLHLNVGVPVFFAISGFVLYRPFVAQRHGAPSRSLGAYARNRFLRIAPAYWVAITLAAIWPGLAGVFTGDWWWYYGLLQIYTKKRELLGLPVAWSLCVEITFYALLPLYAALLARVAGTGRHWLRTELLVLLGLSLASIVAYHWTQLSTVVVTFAWFAVGMAFAVISVAGKHVRIGGTWMWAAALALYVVLCLVLSTSNPLHLGADGAYGTYIAFSCALSACVLAPAIFARSGVPHTVLGWRLVAWLGTISYGLYLYHLIVLVALQRRGWGDWLGGQDVLSYALLALPLTVAFAAASYYLVERPALTLGRRRGGASTAPHRPAPSAAADPGRSPAPPPAAAEAGTARRP
jgi:peptidoglycan/LPS O-acetylase OafA/YrhL